MSLPKRWLSLENFRALASLEVELGQIWPYGHYVVQIWSWHGPKFEGLRYKAFLSGWISVKNFQNSSWLIGPGLVWAWPDLTWTVMTWINLFWGTCIWSAYSLGTYQGNVWTMLGSCLPIFSFSWKSENFGDSVNLIKRIYISSLQIWDHTKLYLDNVMAIFGLALPPD